MSDITWYDDVMCSCTDGTRTVTKAYYVLASDHDAVVQGLRAQLSTCDRTLADYGEQVKVLQQRVAELERELEEARHGG